MKFTFEVEQNDKLYFWDIDILSLKRHYTANPHLVVFTLIPIVLYL